MIPAQWLPSLPPPANGWRPVYYEVSEEGGILRQGEYRVDGDRVWARNDVGVRFLPRERAWPTWWSPGGCCACWTTGCDGCPAAVWLLLDYPGAYWPSWRLPLTDCASQGGASDPTFAPDNPRLRRAMLVSGG